MKKSILFVVALVFAFILTGCGDSVSKPAKSSNEKEMECTVKTSNESYSINSTYTIYYEGDIVNKVYSKEEIKSSDESLLKNTKSTVEATYKEANKQYGGYNYSVKIDGDVLISEATIDYKKMDLEKYIKDTPAYSLYIDDDNNIIVDKLKQSYISMGATCTE